jgi:WhiB family redox-sensing transcriptional regulator
VTAVELVNAEVLIYAQCGRDVAGPELRGGLCLGCWLGVRPDPGPSDEEPLADEAAATAAHIEAAHAWFYLLLSDRDPAKFSELLARPAWQERASCRGMGTGRFFAAGEDLKPARAVRAECPVSAACLDYSLSTDEHLPGIWGGTSERERRKLRTLSAYPCGKCGNPS